MVPLSLKGKKALVFGQGKFTDIALTALIEAGAEPALITWEKGFAEEMGKKFNALSFSVNPLSEDEVENGVKRVIENLGSVDILINETVFEFYHPFTEISFEEWEKGMRLNLLPIFLSTRALGRHFRQKKKGRIINLVSALGIRGVAGAAAFSTFTGGIMSLTKALGIEWSREGVRVNAIGTGWFEGDTDSAVFNKMIPLGRLGKRWEIGPLIIYLASDVSDYVTSQVFFVDGGILVRP